MKLASMEQQPSWGSEGKDKWSYLSLSSWPATPSVSSTLVKESVLSSRSVQVPRDSSTISDKDLLKECSRPNTDAFIQHCFQRFKLREKYPGVLLKLKPTRFGPPAPRRRIFIVPSVAGMPLPSASPQPPEPLGQKLETFTAKKHLEEVDQTPIKDDKVGELDAWIEERKELRNRLDKCADIESWLMGKEPISEQETHVLTRIRESKEAKMTIIKDQPASTSDTEQVLPRKKQKRIVPLVNAPYPESLITLQNLLHKQKLKLVDLFIKEDRTKSLKFKRTDFIDVIKRTQVPISENDLEDAVTHLTAMKKDDSISHSDLAECQKTWLMYQRSQWKHVTKPEELPPNLQTTDQNVDLMTVKRASSFPRKSIVRFQKPKMNYLEVPTTTTERDHMPLSYNKMEEVGKRYKEMRRRLKRKTSPLEWAASCRVVKTGDPVVDNHCLPSTIEGDMGELVDRHRMASHLVWFQCVKLCKQYGIPITEEVLKRALLYSGDILLSYGGMSHKIRQPGGYYETHDRSPTESRISFEEQPETPSKEKKRERAPKKRKGKPLMSRWKSYVEFKELMSVHSRKLSLAAKNLWDEGSFDKSSRKKQKEFQENFIEREMKKMFDYLNPKTDANSFWPGHLLDKLRLYLPEVGRTRADALFSHVSCTHPIYPRRAWRVGELKFVTYGDPEARKHYYYI